MAAPTSSGIYEIVNLVNGKRYVGSAVCLRRRKTQHWTGLARGSHPNRHLQASWNKREPDDFVFRVLLVCSVECLLIYEQLAFTALAPEYNLSPTAGSTLGVVLSTETRSKIAAKALGRVRTPESVERGAAKLRGMKRPAERTAYLRGNKHAAGRSHTEEWKREASERLTGIKRPKSPEWRAKISASLKGVSHSPERRAKQAAAQVGLKHPKKQMRPRSLEETARIGAAISARQVGKLRKPETVEKMRNAATGRVQSPEQRQKISIATKAMWAERREDLVAAQARGRENRPTKKRPSMSPERRVQVSTAMKRMWAERKSELLAARAEARTKTTRKLPDYKVVGAKIAASLRGRKLSAETRAKMSAAHIGKKRSKSDVS